MTQCAVHIVAYICAAVTHHSCIWDSSGWAQTWGPHSAEQDIQIWCSRPLCSPHSDIAHREITREKYHQDRQDICQQREKQACLQNSPPARCFKAEIENDTNVNVASGFLLKFSINEVYRPWHFQPSFGKSEIRYWTGNMQSYVMHYSMHSTCLESSENKSR